MDFIRVPIQQIRPSSNKKQYIKQSIRVIMSKYQYKLVQQKQTIDTFLYPYHQLLDRQIIVIYGEKKLQFKISFYALKRTQKLSRMKSVRNYLEYCYLIKQLNRLAPYYNYTYKIQSNGNVFMVSKVDYSTVFSNANSIYFLEYCLLQMQKYFFKQQDIIKAIILFQHDFLANRVESTSKKQYKQQLIKLKNQLEQLRLNRRNSKKIKSQDYALIAKQNVLKAFKFVTQSFVVTEHVSTFIKKNPFPFKMEIFQKYKPTQFQPTITQKKEINKNAICLGIGIFYQSKKITCQLDSGSHSLIERYDAKFTVVPTIDLQETQQQIQQQQYIQKSQNPDALVKASLVKKVPKSFTLKSPSFNSFMNERVIIRHIRNLQCPYICKYFIYHIEKKKAFYLEYHKINLRKFISDDMKKPSNQKKYTISMKLEMMKGIASAIYFLQYNRILHRDFKPQNILLDKNMVPKVIDFGSSCGELNCSAIKVQEDALLSTPKYFYQYSKCQKYIQEAYNQEDYEKHILFDSYSLGTIIEELFQLNKNIDHSFDKGSIIVQYLNYIRERCKDPNPDDRLSGEQIVAILVLLLNILKQQRMSPQR